MAQKQKRDWRFAQGTCWRARSGAVVVIRRNDHGRIWFESVTSDSPRVLMLTRGVFAATFPTEIV